MWQDLRSTLPTPASLSFVLAAFVTGCGASADLDKAKAVVETSLNKWKQAGKPQELTQQAIDIAEPDWKAGYRLLDYELKNVSAQPQQGPRIVVQLNLQDRAGKKLSKQVAYEVILGDKVRIGRDAFHVEQ
jgi:hypothetical protein